MIYKLMRVLLVCVLAGIFACSDSQLTGPGSAGALQEIPYEDRRIGIVHSEATKNNFYDAFAYNQLFASMQHQSMMAGIPFDLLTEEDLTDTNRLLGYDALLFPTFSHVAQAHHALIRESLTAAQNAGVAIIVAGEFMAYNENGDSHGESGAYTAELLGVRLERFHSDVAITVEVSDTAHPVTSNYQPNETLATYDRIWLGNFIATEGSAISLATLTEDSTEYVAAQIIERTAPVVHFANDQILADNNLLWDAIRWAVYGQQAPVALQISRHDSVFVARNDMDQAMIAATLIDTEIPLLDIITDWKNRFDFVGSYYLDIGNDPANGQYTDWSISAPLYAEYIALGSEIGTHSWTHPHYTRQLSATELEFEFNQSKQEIASRLGVPVVGGAVPGTSETLRVVEELNQWFSYFSGRSGRIGSGYQNAIGFLEPQHDMLYFSLNMAPDFQLIDVLNNTPEQAAQIWKDEIDHVVTHAETPVIHWLWHDYGPTTQTQRGLYSKEMFEDTLAYAYGLGAEFATSADINERIRTFQSARVTVGAGSTISATVESDGVGQFALEVPATNTIKSVANWYAYDDNQVFLADDGGTYEISTGDVPDSVTRITELPMRARLLSLSGDGNELDFQFEGEGEVTIVLSPIMTGNVSVTGAGSFTEQQDQLTLNFPAFGQHTVSLKAITPLNRAPQVAPVVVNGETQQPIEIPLAGSDPDGDTLQYEVVVPPEHGELNGVAPDLSYVSDAGFRGDDGFSYRANDGTVNSDIANVTINVALPRPANSIPVANRQVLETLVDQPLSFLLSGSDLEGKSLTFEVTVNPQHGSLGGSAPNLSYTPDAGFTGTDELQFTVSDGDKVSAAASVLLTVNQQPVSSGATLSNPIATPLIDGTLDEWNTSKEFGSDPDDVSGVSNINWNTAWMGHDDTAFYFAYSLFRPTNLSWGHTVYLDTDTDSTTGFYGFSGEFAIGADYVIEGNNLFRYDGFLQNQWAWEYVQSLSSSTSGDNVELSVPRAILGNPANIELVFNGNGFATGGNELDLFPDNAVNMLALPRLRKFSYSVNPTGNGGNIAPVANSQSINMTNTATVELLLTGADVNGDSLTFSIEENPINGTITGTPPVLSYTPGAGFTGDDSLSFTVFDGELSSNEATIRMKVVPSPRLNSIPLARAQSLSVELNTPLPIELSGEDVDGTALSYTLVTEPSNGVLSGIAPDLVYTPGDGFVGLDQFTFTVSDGVDDSVPAMISLVVESTGSGNTIPAADNLNITTEFETTVDVTLSGSDVDGQSLTFRVVGEPAKGQLQGDAPNLNYIPLINATGADVFTYVSNDGIDDSLPATVTLEILPATVPNTPPVANGQTLSTPFGESLLIQLTGYDADQDALTFGIKQQPASGQLVGSQQTFTYTPLADFSGLDSFEFVADDGIAESAVATVTIDVGANPQVVVSNPVTNITIDGSIGDWSGVTSFGLDPDDISGPDNPLDWREAWVAHDNESLYIAFRNDGIFEISWGHGIYIDTDNDRTTGFRGFSDEFALGADILLETDDVYRYTGTGTSWSWGVEDEAVVRGNGEIGEISLPRSVLGNPSVINFYLRADNTPFGGSAVDHYPNASLDSSAVFTDRVLQYQLSP